MIFNNINLVLEKLLRYTRSCIKIRIIIITDTLPKANHRPYIEYKVYKANKFKIPEHIIYS